MPNAFARLLPRFDSDPVPAPFGIETMESPASAPAPLAADLILEADERGYARGLAAARAEYELIRARDAEHFADKLEAARRQWVRDEAEKLAGQFGLAIRQLEDTIASDLADILASFVSDNVREQAIADFGAVLSQILAQGPHETICVSGPQDMLAELRHALSGSAASFSFSPGEGVEVRAVLDDTIVETQLGAWQSRLAAAVA